MGAAKRTTVVADSMNPVLLGIVRDVVAVDDSTEIVAEGVPPSQIETVLGTMRPDVLVLGSPETFKAYPRLGTLLCGGGSRVRVIVLADDSRTAELHELKEHVVVIDQPSIDSLHGAIAASHDDEVIHG